MKRALGRNAGTRWQRGLKPMPVAEGGFFVRFERELIIRGFRRRPSSIVALVYLQSTACFRVVEVVSHSEEALEKPEENTRSDMSKSWSSGRFGVSVML